MSGYVRIAYNFAIDHRVQMLTEAEQRRFVMVLCIHSEYPESVISDADMAWRMRIPVADWAETKAKLIGEGLLNQAGFPVYEQAQKRTDRLSAEVWINLRSKIFERDDYTCRYCGERGGRLECDHVVPVTRGGDHSEENLVTACFSCNRSKRDKLVSEWKGAKT